MSCKLISLWGDKYKLSEVAEKVKHFFKNYGMNRHKMTTLGPSSCAERYSPDDTGNRFDLRSFIYNDRWDFQFRAIDRRVKDLEKDKNSTD
ncbi:hypothetical protein CHUAL_004463 [Chamberlinius hualienensis]